MKTVLKNRTRFRTDDVRKLVTASLLAVGFPLRTRPRFYSRLTLTIEVATARSGHCSGRAVLGTSPRLPGLHMICRIPARSRWTDDTWRRVVALFVHESMHLVGAEHRDMTRAQRQLTLPLPAWAEKLTPLRERGEP